MVQALLPLKDLVQAKSRLAGLLRPSERRALAQAMVEDVLAIVAGHPQIRRVTLVSDDPGAGLLCGHYGIRYWPESGLGCQGLNAIIRAACERLAGEGDDTLLVLHGDLPLLSREDVSAVLAGQGRIGGLVIGCDHPGRGSNMLAFPAARVPQFCFGPDSCRRHRLAAERAGMDVAILHRPGIALDVDEPADLAALLGQLDSEAAEAAHCRALLQGTGLGKRIRLALAHGPAGLEIIDGKRAR